MTSRRLETVIGAIRGEFRNLDPNLPLFEIKNISEQIAGSYWRQRMTGLLISIFAGLALVLGMAGMYSVMAYTVAERTRELGIRMALGASARDIIGMLLGQSLRPPPEAVAPLVSR